MKNIEPVNVWQNGQAKQASILDAKIIYDDLKTSCTFYYELKESMELANIAGNSLASGNVSLSGENYLSWDGSNDFAYNYVADQLNLIIIPDPIQE